MGSELMEGAQEEQDLLNREWNPALLSLRSLYRGDPFYSLCLADLMRAPQALNHAIVKEQRQLAQTLRKLDTQRLSRLRQLAEERRQFEACMRHRLAPRRPHSTPHGHGPGYGSWHNPGHGPGHGQASNKHGQDSRGHLHEQGQRRETRPQWSEPEQAVLKVEWQWNGYGRGHDQGQTNGQRQTNGQGKDDTQGHWQRSGRCEGHEQRHDDARGHLEWNGHGQGQRPCTAAACCSSAWHHRGARPCSAPVIPVPHAVCCPWAFPGGPGLPEPSPASRPFVSSVPRSACERLLQRCRVRGVELLGGLPLLPSNPGTPGPAREFL
ncbi:uncharacterized protein LOC116957776 isoform X2 [Petromyzon marinus]|nr:uncharacterized protein LOC116957776 isoform X2 [Petromyzon marinus]